ncbi:hypothetical protein GGI20_004046 [Coemansia sp. BCRC 34301]|nr:hypothetical protein GGI20_004046 [Coemansia sp. BCRC 34301]
MDEPARPLYKHECKAVADAFAALASIFTVVAKRAKQREVDARRARGPEPVKPLTAWKTYFKDNLALAKAQDPLATYRSWLPLLTERWKTADAATRQSYQDDYMERLKKYKIDMEAYNSFDPDMDVARTDADHVRVEEASMVARATQLDSSPLPSTDPAHSPEPLERHDESEDFGSAAPPERPSSSPMLAQLPLVSNLPTETTMAACLPDMLGYISNPSDTSQPSLPSEVSFPSLVPMLPYPIMPLQPPPVVLPTEAPVQLPVPTEYIPSSIHAILSGLVAMAESTGLLTSEECAVPLVPSRLHMGDDIANKSTDKSADKSAVPATAKKRKKQSANTDAQDFSAEQVASPRKKKTRQVKGGGRAKKQKSKSGPKDAIEETVAGKEN